MYKRLRKIRNKCGDTRILKLINEGSVISMSCDECNAQYNSKKSKGEEYITAVDFGYILVYLKILMSFYLKS